MKYLLFVCFPFLIGNGPMDKQNPVWESLSYYDVVKQDFLSLQNIMGPNGLALVFVGSHCPYVDKYQERIKNLHKTAKEMGVALVLVNSNSTNGQNIESLENMRAASENLGIQYISDQKQVISQAFEVTRNPEVVLISAKKSYSKVYQGKIDSSPLSATKHTINYVVPLMKKMKEGQVPDYSWEKPVGCRIK